VSRTQPTAAQQAQAEASVRGLFRSSQVADSTRTDLSRTAAEAIAAGYPCDPNAGRTDR
jgi:hypothetical protein